MLTEEEIRGAFADCREIRVAAQKIAALLEQARRPVKVELSGLDVGTVLPDFLTRLQERPEASGSRVSDTQE